ncbi:MAG: hypothetical protein ACR2MY_09095 [Candidatus Dormibacteria bacterium]
MGWRDRLGVGLARQLGHPSGLRGRLVGVMLNRANRAVIAAAIDALALSGGETGADTEMIKRASRRYLDQRTAGSGRSPT